MSLTTVAVNMGGTGAQTPNNAQTNLQTLGFKNRIINGAMVIDQRNNGASVSINGTGLFTLDRWYSDDVSDGAWTVQQSSVAPAGFTNSLLVTITTADASLGAAERCRLIQTVEGFNMSDLSWGTANAKTVTLSFWVRSSVTGTFSGSLLNSAENRSYPYTYTISAANTFEYKTITIAGETTGTWVTNNGIGIRVMWSLGMGSNFNGTAGAWNSLANFGATGATNLVSTIGATFYITGVQLEVGSAATTFDYRPYGTELALCQRYFQKITWADSILMTAQATQTSGASGAPVYFVQEMRASPTITLPTAGSSSGNATFLTSSGAYPATIGTVAANAIRTTGFSISCTGYTSAFTIGNATGYYSTGTATITMSSEL